MDWNAAIEKNRAALKRVLAMLVAMAGLTGFSSPLAGEDGSARRGKAEALAEPGEGCFSRPTLTRHLHRAILRLLRPAESAARRLIIVAARGLVVALPPAYQRKSKPVTMEPALRRFGIAVVMSDGAAAAARRAGDVRAAAVRAHRPRALSLLPLFDPLPGLPSLSKGRERRRYVPAYAAPRISGLDLGAPFRPLPPPPSPDDPVDASRLALRLQALASALDDLPAQARRFARLRAARRGANASGRARRVWPLRPGRPPGQRPANRRQEVHEVLSDLHWFAFEALEHPDTS
ncbi:hypothetical protein [Mesorhizobium sp. KR9-304]|uniref:hypothetical protein n=1 Tax=Mesorhizobium sp. KR9-304 TaxID=3156614 RepID=UPI0032B35D93